MSAHRLYFLTFQLSYPRELTTQFPPFLLDEWLIKYARSDYNLAASTGPHWTFRDMLSWMNEDTQSQLLDTELVYTDPAGETPLREALGDMQGVHAHEIQVVTGASEALQILFFMAAEPGANVIIPEPCYPPMLEIPRAYGLEVRPYTLRREQEYVIDPDEIKKLTDDHTKLILINSPHNPTGATPGDDALADLHDFSYARGIQFIVDEVYHPIYHGRDTPSASRLAHVTILGDFSKSFCLSGLRTGWIVERDTARRETYYNTRGYFSLSNNALGEALATTAVHQREVIFDKVRQITHSNLALLDNFFEAHADTLAWVRPPGGPNAFPWLRHSDDARPFCRMMAEQGVLLVPGDCFGRPEQCAQALDRFSACLQQYEA
jgi:aspartate/methionine/tyrosine aminotransferase